MKKTIAIFAFMIVAQIAIAQDASRADVKKLIELTGGDAQIAVAKKKVLEMIPEAKQTEFLKEFDMSLIGYLAKIEDFYIKEYTSEDIQKMIVFYETPIGKKMKSKAGLQAESSMSAIQSWSVELQGIIMKYMK
ncbi:DUF2059 domain-containing protein [Flavobacterium sp. CF136]|jgi:hypothetical protein|uniref:DUF2059 domain-containing protein n=1 Tax=Flavobacterium sp. (strain CF136) TaxID=1144313 RepID=UPI000271970F|nr:DUF2059 domain-containing protein [Flavobacterium sp. CF136]EJL60340.1 hypothetical protein PMI10_03873 [Flavobacterium sp. CF136]